MSDSAGPAVEPTAAGREASPSHVPEDSNQVLVDREELRAAGWFEPSSALVNDKEGEDPLIPAWLSDAAVYEYDGEVGDVGPVNEELEKQLFHSDLIVRAGYSIEALHFKIDVESDVAQNVLPVKDFADGGLHPMMLDNVRLCQYKVPTPIQAYCLPAIGTGLDVIGHAQTGSGKTAAYLIPTLSKFMGKARDIAAPRPHPLRYNRDTDRVIAEPLMLIVCPSRELAGQIFDETRRLCYRSMLRPCVVYGGAPAARQRESLEKGCDVLVATPGRLFDFMQNKSLISLKRLKFTVLDEADELLGEDWNDVMEQILEGNDGADDEDHSYLMFSATFPSAARKIAARYMAKDHVRIKVGRIGSTHKNITQGVVWVDERAKNRALIDLIKSCGVQRTLIFVNARDKVDRVDDFLFHEHNLPSTSIHSGRTQRERESSLLAFKAMQAPILVATGVSARGLDVSDVKHVVNYDLPSAAWGGITEYVHRIGRTGRIGNHGVATSFYNDRNEDIAVPLVKLLMENEQAVPDFLESFKEQAADWESEDEGDEGDDPNPAGIDEPSAPSRAASPEAFTPHVEVEDDNKVDQW